jgi:hypothetical protein
MKLEINLDEITVGHYGDTITNIIKDEIMREVRNEVRKSLKKNPSLNKAIKVMQEKAADSLLEMVSK